MIPADNVIQAGDRTSPHPAESGGLIRCAVRSSDHVILRANRRALNIVPGVRRRSARGSMACRMFRVSGELN